MQILLNEYKLLHALSIVKIKQLEAVLFTFLNNTRAKLRNKKINCPRLVL